MASKLYLLNDASVHMVSEDLQEMCDLPLDVEPVPYVVIATVDLDRDEEYLNEPNALCEVRLDVLSGLGALLGSDYQAFELSGVSATAKFESFDRTPSSRHVSLMVTATVPDEGGSGRNANLPFTLDQPETAGETLLLPPPRAVLSARGQGLLGTRSSLALSNVRILAFQADQVVVKNL